MITAAGQYHSALLSRHDGLKDPKALCRMEEGGLAVAQGNGEIKIFATSSVP